MKLTLSVIAIFSAFLAMPSKASTITFSDREDLVYEVSSEKFSQIVKTTNLEVWEPHENKKFIYRGYLLTDVLNYIYGEEWKKVDLIYFICSDGYKAPIPRFNVESTKSILAIQKFDLHGRELSFTIDNLDQHQGPVSLAPFYLVWDNRDDATLKADGATHWPYQVMALELWNYDELFKKSLPSENASVEVHKGFRLFQKYCVSCHKIKGEGGDKGSELILNHLVENLSNDYLKMWIDNPAGLNADTNMPPLNKNIKARDQAINNIIAYLRAMNATP
jgi:cytochrome c2